MQSGGEKEVFLTPLLTGLLLHVSDGNVLRHVTGVVKSFPGVMRIAGAESPSSEEGDGDLQLKLFQILDGEKALVIHSVPEQFPKNINSSEV